MKIIPETRRKEIDMMEVESHGHKNKPYQIHDKKSKFCRLLETRLNRIPGAEKTIVLTLFFLAGFGYNISVIVNHIYPGASPNLHTLKVPEAPVNVLTQGPGNFRGRAGFSKSDQKEIQRLIYALDSLKHSAQGLKTYQNYIRAHPGLLDSLKGFHNLIEAQSIQ